MPRARCCSDAVTSIALRNCARALQLTDPSSSPLLLLLLLLLKVAVALAAACCFRLCSTCERFPVSLKGFPLALLCAASMGAQRGERGGTALAALPMLLRRDLVVHHIKWRCAALLDVVRARGLSDMGARGGG
jgi:hypothetical protein